MKGIVAPHTHSAVSRYLPDIAAISLKEITLLPTISDPSPCFNSRWVKSLSLASAAAGRWDNDRIKSKNAKVDNLQTLKQKFRDLLKSLKNLKTLNKNVI